MYTLYLTFNTGKPRLLPVMFLLFQMDPGFFPQPENFDPERFSRERKNNIKPGTFLPFGMGPRQCLGMKIALVETKIFLCEILRHFTVEPCERTTVPLTWSKAHFNRLQGGCWLKFKRRDF